MPSFVEHQAAGRSKASRFGVVFVFGRHVSSVLSLPLLQTVVKPTFPFLESPSPVGRCGSLATATARVVRRQICPFRIVCGIGVKDFHYHTVLRISGHEAKSTKVCRYLSSHLGRSDIEQLLSIISKSFLIFAHGLVLVSAMIGYYSESLAYLYYQP